MKCLHGVTVGPRLAHCNECHVSLYFPDGVCHSLRAVQSIVDGSIICLVEHAEWHYRA